MDNYAEYHLPDCERFINKIWQIDNSTSPHAIHNLNILPNGCFNIALLIGQGAKVYVKNKKYNFKQGIYLCSQFTAPVKLTLLKHTQVNLIQIKAWYFSYHAKQDFSGFIDEIALSNSDHELFGMKLNLNEKGLIDKLKKLTIDHISDFQTVNSQKNIVEKVADKIIEQSGKCSISALFEQFEQSDRWIQKEFKKSTGLSPKHFAKIIQFRKTVDKMTYSLSKENLTAISSDAGYTDQSHFIKNFKGFLELSPSRFDPKNFVLSHKK